MCPLGAVKGGGYRPKEDEEGDESRTNASCTTSATINNVFIHSVFEEMPERYNSAPPQIFIGLDDIG
jgi:hypothetical protein